MNNEQAHEQARNALFGNIVMSTPKEKAISESDSHDSHEQNQSHSVEKISTQISTLTNATQRNQSQNLRKVYSHILLDDCITAKPIQWLIQGYLRKKGTAMLFGASGSAKSFIATDMSMHVAFKKFSSWNGKPIKHGAVIYFAGEDTEGLKMRIRGWMTEHGVTPNEGEFVIIDEPLALMTKILNTTLRIPLLILRLFVLILCLSFSILLSVTCAAMGINQTKSEYSYSALIESLLNSIVQA